MIERGPVLLLLGTFAAPSLLTHTPKAYISGNAFSVLTGPDALLQTVYDDDASPLQAIAFDEASGWIATCTGEVVRLYQPFGQHEDALKVYICPRCPGKGDEA